MNNDNVGRIIDKKDYVNNDFKGFFTVSEG